MCSYFRHITNIEGYATEYNKHLKVVKQYFKLHLFQPFVCPLGKVMYFSPRKIEVIGITSYITVQKSLFNLIRNFLSDKMNILVNSGNNFWLPVIFLHRCSNINHILNLQLAHCNNCTCRNNVIVRIWKTIRRG